MYTALIDTEDSVVRGFDQGPLCILFGRSCTVTNYRGTVNNWSPSLYKMPWLGLACVMLVPGQAICSCLLRVSFKSSLYYVTFN